MRKYTLSEIFTQLGRLHLFAITHSCECCERAKPADMSVVTRAGVPIFVCTACALALCEESAKQSNGRLPRIAAKATRTPANGVTVKRGRPRKVAR